MLPVYRVLCGLSVIAALLDGFNHSAAGEVPKPTDAPATRKTGSDGAIYLSDLSACQPASALSSGLEPEKWRVISYETVGGLKGKLVHAESIIQAPEIRLPLAAKGWHKIYVAFWDPEFSSDGRPLLKFKLSGQPGFRLVDPPARPDNQDATYLEEVYFDCADVTDQDLVIGKSNGTLSKNASIAYVKLIPLAKDEQAAAEADRTQDKTRNLVATIDGQSYFHVAQFDRPEHILNQVALYQHSDVAKVQWAVCYGAATNFPSQTPGSRFLGNDRTALANGMFLDNDYLRGQYQMRTTLLSLAAQGQMPENIAAEAVHKMGLKFDLMFRLGITCGVAQMPFLSADGLDDYRQVNRDGTLVSKASYAYPQVQKLMLGLIREAAQAFDADGINLCFVRGPHFLQYEQPVAAAFQAKYQEDVASVGPDDPRWGQVRATFITDFVRQVRTVLDDVGKQKKKRLTLSVWVWPQSQNVWLGATPLEEGLDVAGWIRSGLLDSVICQEGIDPQYVALGKQHNCQFILFTGYRGDVAMSPKTVTAAYDAGVESFAYWDLDLAQISASQWNWLRRIGHRQEMADWPRYNPGDTLNVRLKMVDGVDVQSGLAQAVYSGG